MFPNNTKSAVLDKHSGTSGEFLPAVAHDRVILQASIQCSASNDAHLIIGSTITQPNNNNIVDLEGGGSFINQYTYRLLPADQPVYWEKALTNTRCFYSMNYLDSLPATTTGQFTYDGIMTNMFLLFIFIILLFNFTYGTIIGVKQKPRKYD